MALGISTPLAMSLPVKHTLNETHRAAAEPSVEPGCALAQLQDILRVDAAGSLLWSLGFKEQVVGGDIMSGSWRYKAHPRIDLPVWVAMVTLFAFFSQAARHKPHEQRHIRDMLLSTEIPAEFIAPPAIDLTSLVNTLINSTQSGSQQLFSLLSVTSYSSLSLHKLTLLVYNISSFKSIESNMFSRRYCYCVSNETNDLTDFTAILLDVMENSTSYLHELFKSASILSVSQRNNSDCIYICVMAGRTDEDSDEGNSRNALVS